MKFNMKNQQRGATLITSLVMLVVLTLLVISAVNSSRSNLRIAGNMQMQEEVIAAAQQATEQVISGKLANVVAANITLNINNAPYVVAVSPPVCTGSTPLTNGSDNLPETCISSDAVRDGPFFTANPAAALTSWCSAQQWDVRTQVTDVSTGANATLHQGVSMNVKTGTVEGNCIVGLPTP